MVPRGLEACSLTIERVLGRSRLPFVLIVSLEGRRIWVLATSGWETSRSSPSTPLGSPTAGNRCNFLYVPGRCQGPLCRIGAFL